MSKILVIGDIHGHNSWEQIISENYIREYDRIIFLGDYVDSFTVSSKDQINNLNKILDFKEQHINQVVLLRGNHDCSSGLGYYWARCSGFNQETCDNFPKEKFLSLSKWIHVEDMIIFSHAGLTNLWLENTNNTIDSVNLEPPSQIFGFWLDDSVEGMYDIYGTSKTQGPLWIRPQTLVRDNICGFDQVVGHTQTKEITNAKQSAKGKQNIWLCDTLGIGQYLILDNGNAQICKIGGR